MVDSLHVQTDNEIGVTLNKLKEQVRSKYQSIKKQEIRQTGQYLSKRT